GRWSLTADGQPLALDFDEARLELPAGMGAVAVTADVTADTAHLTFSTPYGAGVMRLVHASDRVTGSMSVAGQSAAVTGERAIVTPEPDVPVPPVEPEPDPPADSTPAPPSTGEPFFEDDFDNGRLNSANGFTWRSSRYVDVVEIDGRRALRFRYGPVEPNGQSHMWAEQRFDLPGQMKEVWVEYLIRYPADFQHGPNTPNNDKFFRLWGGGQSAYSGNINKVGMSTRPRSIRFEYTEYGKTVTGHFTAPAAVPWENDLGRWIQVRMHYKHPSAPGSADGRMRLWKDGKLLVDFRNVNQAWNSSAPFWDSGYFMGYDNSRLSREFHIYIDDVKFFDTDPGW